MKAWRTISGISSSGYEVALFEEELADQLATRGVDLRGDGGPVACQLVDRRQILADFTQHQEADHCGDGHAEAEAKTRTRAERSGSNGEGEEPSRVVASQRRTVRAAWRGVNSAGERPGRNDIGSDRDAASR